MDGPVSVRYRYDESITTARTQRREGCRATKPKEERVLRPGKALHLLQSEASRISEGRLAQSAFAAFVAAADESFLSNQRDMAAAISMLFFSSIIMWPLPWMPISSSFIQVR